MNLRHAAALALAVVVAWSTPAAPVEPLAGQGLGSVTCAMFGKDYQ
jgi:hypothetical protein